MAIRFKSGDMFAEPVEALVNTVNCVGVMGKGVALEFKRRWPKNFRSYKRLCEQGNIVLGSVFVFENVEMFQNSQPRFIINFPTKKHWRSRSKIEDIESGLDALVDSMDQFHIRSIAMPPLGCGNGGLDWKEVKPLIQRKLACLHDVEIVIFEPIPTGDGPEHKRSNFSMTFERAVLLRSLVELEIHFEGKFDRISLQKIVYFLQALGTNFRLSFSRNLFGPYSDVLKQAFLSLERQGMITGFTAEGRMTHVLPSAYATADEFLTKGGLSSRASDLTSRLDKLIQGYETPYGLELLSSVHYLATSENTRPVDKVVEAMSNWSENKRNRFSPKAIEAAYLRLEEDGLI